MVKRLRSGFTTGACAAAAAKAAALLMKRKIMPEQVEIPFPDGSRHSFVVHRAGQSKGISWASIIKDAGDDPDVTNGAEIRAAIYWSARENDKNYPAVGAICLRGGKGVGRATKPGLAIKPGEPAINPVPRQMIAAAVNEVMADQPMLVEISVTDGEELAEKTLNRRLGIIGGLSILGTTGIVRPISAEAWTATIKASMRVARAAGLDEIVLATGRTSERGAQSRLNLAEEAYAMMGDYLEFSLLAAAELKFKKIHLAGMWAKIVKAALEIPQTHVRNGALEMRQAADLLAGLGAGGSLQARISRANTAREMFQYLEADKRYDIIRAVCLKAGEYARQVSGLEVKVYLVNHRGKVLYHV